MAETGIKEFFAKKIEGVRDSYVKDLESMSTDMLCKGGGGASRTPYDFTFEAVFVNKRIAQRLRGETPAPMGDDNGWMTAPSEFCNKEEATKAFKNSMDEILAALGKVDESKMLEPVMTPGGESSMMNFAYFACLHNEYHDAQLNYLQAMSGDDKVHW